MSAPYGQIRPPPTPCSMSGRPDAWMKDVKASPPHRCGLWSALSDTIPFMKASSPPSTRGPMRAHYPFFYGWVILSVASLAMFISGPGQTYSFSVFVNPIREEMGWSQTMIASLYTAGSLTASAGLLVVGRLLDRFGARVVLTAVGLAFGLGALWMSRINSQGDLYLGFTIMRLLGQGSLTLISTMVVAIWFIRLRGRVMAINSLGAVISQAVFPPLIFLLISHVDWRSTWIVLALLIWAMTVLPAIVLVRRSPESIGLLPDGEGVDVPAEATDGAPQHP
ncbi:MFS transporter [Chloroflexota bacterium]